MHRKRSLGHSFVILRVVVFCVFMFSGQEVCADGKHFPEKAYKQAPAIPSQRAILTYKDGVEKLTIESALDGKGREFGWVIPLPAKPTEFEKTSPGLIKTFSLILQPNIVHDLKEELGTLWRIAALITFGSFIFVATKPPLRILWLVLFFFIFVGLSAPHLGIRWTDAASTDIPGIRVHGVGQVGSYELAVLETETLQALDAWLGENGFAGLSKEDEKIVSDYVQDGWYFVAAKLRREGDGYGRPHPLSMSFACDKPVYPIRLTGTVGSNVYLELYVIADKQATCELLTLEVSDAYRLRKGKGDFSGRVAPSDFAGKTYRQNVGHSDAAEFMWDGCILSKLCGKLKPEQMDEDITLQLRKGEPFREHYYSRRGARDTGLAVFLRIWCVLPVLLAVVYHLEKKGLSVRRDFVKKALISSVLLSFLVWALIYAVLPKIDVHTSSGSKRTRIKQHIMASKLLIFAEGHNDFAGNRKDEIAELVAGYFESNETTNIYTGEPIRHEDSPGDYTIIEDDRGVVWRTYSQGGHPDDYVIKPARED